MNYEIIKQTIFNKYGKIRSHFYFIRYKKYRLGVWGYWKEVTHRVGRGQHIATRFDDEQTAKKFVRKILLKGKTYDGCDNETVYKFIDTR